MGCDKTERRRHGDLPSRAYSSLPMSQLGCQRVRQLSGAAVRVLLVAHANSVPDGAVISVNTTSRRLKCGKASVGKALAELKAAGLLSVKREAVRPIRMGAKSPGEAAVYHVAGRHSCELQSVLVQGDRQYQGMWRIYSDQLREVASKLSGNEARILICLMLPCDRTRDGAPQRPIPARLSGRTIAQKLQGMSARAADTAIRGLLEKGLIATVNEPSGRRSGSYTPIGQADSTIQRGGQRKARTNGSKGQVPVSKGAGDHAVVDTSIPPNVPSRAAQMSMVTTRGSGSARKPPYKSKEVADLRRQHGGHAIVARVARRLGTANGHLRAALDPSTISEYRNEGAAEAVRNEPINQQSEMQRPPPIAA